MDEFLQNFKFRFRATTKKLFKCLFTIENTQNSIRADLQPLLNTRYWTTETYDSIYFNDFIFYSLKNDILRLKLTMQIAVTMMKTMMIFL